MSYIERYRPRITGWMSEPELEWLHNTASIMQNIAEVGSWHGRSTHALLTGCPGTVYAVDHWRGSPADQYVGTEADFLEFCKNVGWCTNLRILRGESTVVAQEVSAIDMTFIDGCHTHEAVVQDIAVWLPRTRRLICGHDYPFVAPAVHEFFARVAVVGSIWYTMAGTY